VRVAVQIDALERRGDAARAVDCPIGHRRVGAVVRLARSCDDTGRLRSGGPFVKVVGPQRKPAATAQAQRATTVGEPRRPSVAPAPLQSADGLLDLQRSAGNRAVGQMLPRAEGAGPLRPLAAPAAALQRHSSWEHQLLGDAKPDDLAKIGTWKDLIAQTARQGITRQPRQKSASVTIDLGGAIGQVSVTKGNVMHILAQHLQLLSDWQDNPPTQDSRGQVDQTYQTVLLSVPGGKEDGSPLVITYGEMNTLADYYGNVEVMRTADKAKRHMVIQSVRQETFFRLKEIYTKLTSSLTSTERRDQDVVSSLAKTGKNKRFTQRHGYKLGYKFKGAMTPDLVSGKTGQVDLLKFGGAGGSKTNEYAATLGRNACHFVPESWHAWASYHQKARDLATEAAKCTAQANRMRAQHPKQADRFEAEAADRINEALITNGFGDHYLQDSYAAGHMINKSQIMQWFVQWLDKHDWKADFATDENWRRVQAIAYNQPGIADAMQYDKSKIQGASAAQTTNRARNPQAVEDIQGGWKTRFDALGLKVPDSLSTQGSDTRILVEWWQEQAATGGGLEQSGAALDARIRPRAALFTALDALIKDAVITPIDLDAAYAGRKLMSGRHKLDELPWNVLGTLQFRLRKDYVPHDMKAFRAQQKKSAAGDDAGYQDKAAAITYQDFFQFLNHGYVQKSTNALHDKFCKKGLDIVTGDGQHAFRVYGDDSMFRSNSADGVKHSGETAHMSRDAVLSIINGQAPAKSTSDILTRLPSKVQPDGAAAPVDLALWHDPAAKDLLHDYCETKIFPKMGVLDKAVGIFGDLSKFISKDYAPPHGAEAF
jgi:hypothetical protein